MTLSKTEQRLKRIMALVPWVLANPYPQVDEVIERFGYSGRQELAKDLGVLMVCGVPGHFPHEMTVAYIEDDEVVLDMADYLSRPLKLTPSEALGLLSAALAVAGISEGNQALDRAIEKLTDSLMPQSESAVSVELPREPECMATLRQAAGEGQVLEITYVSTNNNRITVREIEPIAVQVSIGNWYLQAFCRRAGDHRIFRADRIGSVRITDQSFQPPSEPPDFRFKGYTPSADAIYARLALGRKARWLVEYFPVDVLEDTGEELIVRIAMSNARVGARILLRLGNQARLVEGEEVREETNRLRQAILSRYEQETSSR